jgi:hypothetical protein
LLYDTTTKRIVGATGAAELGVPHFDPSSKTSKKTKKQKTERPKVVASIEPPEGTLSAGKPKATVKGDPDDDDGGKKPPPPTAAAKKKEDEADIAELLIAGTGMLAATTGFTPFRMTDEQAGAIARPGARMLARHKHIEKAIRKYSDPIALVVATSQYAIPTLMSFRMWQANGSPPLDQYGRVIVSTPPPPPPGGSSGGPPPPPPPPADNGTVRPGRVNGVPSDLAERVRANAG